MQLVEQGKLALDDVELVEKIAPVSIWTALGDKTAADGYFNRNSRKSKSLRARSSYPRRRESLCECYFLIQVSMVPDPPRTQHTMCTSTSRLTPHSWLRLLLLRLAPKRLLRALRHRRVLRPPLRHPLPTPRQPTRRSVGIRHQYRLGWCAS